MKPHSRRILHLVSFALALMVSVSSFAKSLFPYVGSYQGTVREQLIIDGQAVQQTEWSEHGPPLYPATFLKSGKFASPSNGAVIDFQRRKVAIFHLKGIGRIVGRYRLVRSTLHFSGTGDTSWGGVIHVVGKIKASSKRFIVVEFIDDSGVPYSTIPA